MLLSDISDTTGGRLFTLDNVDDMSDIAAKIANELRNQYMVVYRPRMSVRDGKWHKISVRLSLPKECLACTWQLEKGITHQPNDGTKTRLTVTLGRVWPESPSSFKLC